MGPGREAPGQVNRADRCGGGGGALSVSLVIIFLHDGQAYRGHGGGPVQGVGYAQREEAELLVSGGEGVGVGIRWEEGAGVCM